VITVKRDLGILGLIALFLAIIVGIAWTGNTTAFWYGQIILQLLMASIALIVAFGGGKEV
jgi:hypothetical protein